MQSYYYSGSAGGNTALNRSNTMSFGINVDFFGQLIVPTYTLDATILGKGAQPGSIGDIPHAIPGVPSVEVAL